jgi:hypothetical protein
LYNILSAGETMMQWKKEQPGELCTSGDYELVRWDKGSFFRRWGVYYRRKHVDTVHSLADAKWLAEDHRLGLHQFRLEESGNTIDGGAQ